MEYKTEMTLWKMSKQYTTNIDDCKDDNFQFKYLDFFLKFAPIQIVGTRF